MLDYRIKTFLTLYREMNYRKTAEILNMTQPGVTQHIHFIEDYYNVKLFNWSGKSLSRTPEAEALKAHLEENIAREKEVLRNLSATDKIHLDIGATKTIGDYVITDAVAKYLSNSSHSLTLDIDNTENLLRKIDCAQLQFALIEGVFDKSKYKHSLLKKESFLGVCAKNHPFANKVVSLNQLLSQTLVLREVGSGTRMLFEQAVHNLGYSLKDFSRCVSVSSFPLVLKLVLSLGAVTFAYAPVAENSAELATFRVEDISIVGEFNFVYLSEKSAENIKLLFPKVSPR